MSFTVALNNVVRTTVAFQPFVFAANRIFQIISIAIIFALIGKYFMVMNDAKDTPRYRENSHFLFSLSSKI